MEHVPPPSSHPCPSPLCSCRYGRGIVHTVTRISLDLISLGKPHSKSVRTYPGHRIRHAFLANRVEFGLFFIFHKFFSFTPPPLGLGLSGHTWFLTTKLAEKFAVFKNLHTDMPQNMGTWRAFMRGRDPPNTPLPGK